MGRPKKLPQSYVRWVQTEEQGELARLREQMSAAQWKVGDLALALFQREKETAGIKRTGELIKAVGIFAGMKAKNVRQAMRIAAAYSRFMRDEFSFLSFDYFDRALRFAPDNPRRVLEWCRTYQDERGYLPSLDVLDVELGKNAPRYAPMSNDELDTPNAVARDQGIRRRKARYAAKEVITAIQKNQVELPPNVDPAQAVELLEQLRSIIGIKENNVDQGPTDHHGEVLEGVVSDNDDGTGHDH